jgi:hypothetical protein
VASTDRNLPILQPLLGRSLSASQGHLSLPQESHLGAWIGVPRLPIAKNRQSSVVQSIGTDFGCATAEILHRTSNTVLWLVSNQIPCFEARRVNSMLFQNCRDGIVLAIAQYRISHTWSLVDARSLQNVSRVYEALELLGCKPGSDVNFDIPYSKPFDPNGFPASGAYEPSHLDALH